MTVTDLVPSGSKILDSRYALDPGLQNLITELERHAHPQQQNGATYNEWQAYGQTKTANMLYSLSLAEKLKPRNITSLSLHPGGLYPTTELPEPRLLSRLTHNSNPN